MVSPMRRVRMSMGLLKDGYRQEIDATDTRNNPHPAEQPADQLQHHEFRPSLHRSGSVARIAPELPMTFYERLPLPRRDESRI
jgi:hypothetical protein